jgi:hypothetical protein
MFASFTFVVSSFRDMDDDIGGLGSIKIWFSKKVGTISLKEWKFHYFLKMWVKRQRNLIFNPWWAFELLLQHLEHEASETYESWIEQIVIQAKLLIMEEY